MTNGCPRVRLNQILYTLATWFDIVGGEESGQLMLIEWLGKTIHGWLKHVIELAAKLKIRFNSSSSIEPLSLSQITNPVAKGAMTVTIDDVLQETIYFEAHKKEQRSSDKDAENGCNDDERTITMPWAMILKMKEIEIARLVSGKSKIKIERESIRWGDEWVMISWSLVKSKFKTTIKSTINFTNSKITCCKWYTLNVILVVVVYKSNITQIIFYLNNFKIYCIYNIALLIKKVHNRSRYSLLTQWRRRFRWKDK